MSFKDIDQNNIKAKQRLIDMFINKVVLFDDHVDIYFNASDDKKTHLKLKEMPEDGELFENKTNKKQPEATTGSDCSQLAAPTLSRLNFHVLIMVSFLLLSNFLLFNSARKTSYYIRQNNYHNYFLCLNYKIIKLKFVEI